jgi:hypothetical protein
MHRTLQSSERVGRSSTTVARVTLQRKARLGDGDTPDQAPLIVREVLGSPGQPLETRTRAFFEERFGHDFSGVRVHTNEKAAQSARAVDAQAYTVGRNIVFDRGHYIPRTRAGRDLLAHELAHVVQQGSRAQSGSDLVVGRPDSAHEAQADAAADAVAQGRSASIRGSGIAANVLHRRVEMRDVGRGESSGFARLPELVNRLNAISTGLTFAMVGRVLTAVPRGAAPLSRFDQQMTGFITQTAVLPLRLTTRHGRTRDPDTGRFDRRVAVDEWRSGYVDIDDLLASTDLGLQVALMHFLTERAATRNYAQRIGTPGMDPDASAAATTELLRHHQQGVDEEVLQLREFFGDPTIRFVSPRTTEQIFRTYTNGRGDLIRMRVTPGRGAAGRGIDAVSIEVRTRDGRTLSADAYRRLIAGGHGGGGP